MSEITKDFKPFIKKAEWLDTFYPHGAKPGTNNRDVRYESGTSQMPVTKKESHLLQWLSKTDLK